MAKQYKGFKGSGKNNKKMARYKIREAVNEALVQYIANGCKVPKKKGEE